MGGEEKDNSHSTLTVEQPKQTDATEAEIPKLLKHFDSVELFSRLGGLPQKNNASEWEDVVATFKHLHVRRRPLCRRKKNKKYLLKKCSIDLLNIAIAAGNFPKPIVWPARLSCGCKKPGAPLLNSPKLGVVSNSTVDSSVNVRIPCASCETKPASCKKKAEESNRPPPQNFGHSCNTASLSFGTVGQHQQISTTPRETKTNTSVAANNQLATDNGIFAGRQLFTNTTLMQLPSSLDHPLPSSSPLSAGHITMTARSPSAHSAAPPTSRQQQQLPSCSFAVSQEYAASSQLTQDMEETNVNELASYLEELLHIPRKMSSMAEMMYA